MRGKLDSIRVENFKAIADSGTVKLGPLTVFIGNNGSGKSSVIEALQSVQRLVTMGLDGAMQVFKGMEHVRHKAVVERAARRPGGGEASIAFHAIRFLLRGRIPSDAAAEEFDLTFRSETQLNATGDADRYFVEVDEFDSAPAGQGIARPVETNRRRSKAVKLIRGLGPFVSRWQFLSLDPAIMGDPTPTRRTGAAFLLDPSGANLADYLWHLVRDHGEEGTAAWDGIVAALRFVLPYAGDVQPTQTTELERRSSLALQERFGSGRQRRFEVPAWMLSTGTLRVLALLAVLRHPDPPPLICIEEIENGLDPRTLNLIVDELKRIVKAGRSQIILTTHSPYLLDLLPLSSIVVTGRAQKGVKFWRPDEKKLRLWAERFRPGRLYTMGKLTQEDASEGD